MDFDELERLRRRRQPALADAPFPALGRVQTDLEAPVSPDPTSGDPVVSFALDLAAGLLVVVLFVVPFFSGGHLPLVWGAVALLVGSTLALCQTLILVREPARPAALTGIRAPFGLALVMPAFAIVQILPLGLGGEASTASISPDAALIGLVRLASVVFLFLLAMTVVANRRRAVRLGWALFAVADSHAVLALAKGGPDGITGGFANHNSFAAFVGMGLILGIALVTVQSEREANTGAKAVWLAERLLLGLALFVLAVALFSSGSRLGVVSAVCGGLCLLALRGPGSVWFFLMLGIGALVALILAGAGLLQRAVLLGPATQTRAELYGQVFEMIRARPIAGWGLDSFPLAFEMAHRPPVSSGLVWDQTHNSYLSLWVEMGLIAGSAPMVALFWCGMSLLRENRSPRGGKALRLAALGVLVTEAVHALGDFSLEIAGNLYFFVAIMALGLSRTAPGGIQERR